MKTIKIAYLGGGSKAWARVFMNDLALADGLAGEIALYDIDPPAAQRNQKIGTRISAHPDCRSAFVYTVARRLETALDGADFVVISILPGTFREMAADVHLPEKFRIWQSVGDTAGPGGVIRAMRTVPIFEEFARAIRDHCPNAWVMNFTNPMSICVKTLHDAFPGIKAFGCCHEVFHAQEFLGAVYHEMTGLPRPSRREIATDVSGINHFTWITKARYEGKDLFSLLPGFIEKFYEQGYSEYDDHEAWKHDYFSCGNKVKENLFLRYGVLPAAGDRHLAEFLNNKWYLGSPEEVKEWQFSLTPVSFRIADRERRIRESEELAQGIRPILLEKSGEEAVELMQALLGMGEITSNVNVPNNGQMPAFPHGSVVETNCVFSGNSVKPIRAYGLPGPVKNLVLRACLNVDDLYQGIKDRNLDGIFAAFVHQPLCSTLSLGDAKTLFRDMCWATREYLDPFYDLTQLPEK